MNHQTPKLENFNKDKDIDRVMEQEQFTQIVEAILAGKYSWACVLILRFAGYNPLHYIPYRTYNRIVKDNRQNKQLKCTQLANDRGDSCSTLNNSQVHNQVQSLQKHASQLTDLSYPEVMNDESSEVCGGHFSPWAIPSSD